MRFTRAPVRHPVRLLRLAIIQAAALGLSATAQAQDIAETLARGARIYETRCISCHGKLGEGVPGKREEPLAGAKSLQQLSRYIERSMPEDKPGTCLGDEAADVARYIFETFYSPIAQARLRPARIEPSRLTVRQLQNAVADLVGSFRKPAPRAIGPGLRGEYFDARQPGGKSVLDRIDPEVRFDFGRATPALDGLATTGFAARWSGSLLAPDTGEYEIIVRTDHAARLWLNDPETPIIDAWVKSGSDTEYRASIFLLGGRAYSLRLELTSRKQGVDDKDKEKQKSDKKTVETLIELCWKPPRRVIEVVPALCLIPETASEVFVPRAAFPPDDRSAGYERGASVSKAWDDAATETAIETADYVARRLEELSGAGKEAPDREARARRFLEKLAERAFRRPPGDAERQVYVERRLASAPDVETAVKRAVILLLKSPRFLCVELGDRPLDAYSTASRLSFALWDSIPDDRLLEAAAAGRLGTRDQVAAEAERMMHDPRTRAKARQFFHFWLGVDNTPELAKDSKRFPRFSPELASDLRTSLELFLEDVVWGDDPDFRKLLLSRDIFLNGRLAEQYGVDLPADAPFQKVRVDPVQRAGILSHPYVLSRLAHSDSSSPIHRGVFLVRSVLGQALRPPPEAFTPLPPELHPDLTTRQRVTLQTEPKACQPCHQRINPLGFALENFDAIGRYRSEEGGKPIDASGFYEQAGGERKAFQGPRQLAEILAGSEESHRAFVTQLFHYVVKQPILAHGPETVKELDAVFAKSRFHIRDLLREIAVTSALNGFPSCGKPELLRSF